ncbi:helix-turn-helix domain-containing protein [Myroides fluvii]|uniref:helix-turn-helix domain-containing protein n=1 Tax=Myroides fluvii TaxID=2572594 RepID=UPI00131D4397|nr:AraC family transcriptional regulator [Myroides fluvii]
MNSTIKISHYFSTSEVENIQAPYYYILLLDGGFAFSLDQKNYHCQGKTILFMSPFQQLEWLEVKGKSTTILCFHGDFYCIEYHKKEVACNGILFNNIYHAPFIGVSATFYEEIQSLFTKIAEVEETNLAYNVSILKSYLQLILALVNREKQREIHQWDYNLEEDCLQFKHQLEQSFAQHKSVVYYAELNGIALASFSKKIKKIYGKTPTQLIQERLVLEAKKLLHLTTKPMKEIATALGFEDEFYFSRYFKKATGVSPSQFRKEVGISIVAKKSR